MNEEWKWRTDERLNIRTDEQTQDFKKNPGTVASPGF